MNPNGKPGLNDSLCVRVDAVKIPANIQALEEVLVEAPLRLQLNAEAFTMTMRTPGNDQELAIGMLISEGKVTCDSKLKVIRLASPSIQESIALELPFRLGT